MKQINKKSQTKVEKRHKSLRDLMSGFFKPQTWVVQTAKAGVLNPSLSNKKFIGKKLVFILLLILFIKEITAIGIVTMYLENNTLYLMEGTSETYEIQLQNTEEEVEVRLVLDSEIAEIIDYKERYVLPAGISNTPIIFDISAPEDAKVGDEYVISYYMEQTSTKGGAVPFGVKINKHFTVKIIEDPDKPGTDGYLYRIIIGGVVLMLVVIIFVRRYKKSKTQSL